MYKWCREIAAGLSPVGSKTRPRESNRETWGRFELLPCCVPFGEFLVTPYQEGRNLYGD